MTIARSFVTFLETLGLGTFEVDIFIGDAPSSQNVPDSIWWLIVNGGSPELKASTGELVKNYQIQIYYRNRNYQTVYDNMFTLEEQLNCDGCTQLDGFETIDIEATTFPVDNDLDVEDRKVGLLQANIRTYKTC